MEMTEAEKKIEGIEKKLDNLPNEIIKKINETMDLKIKNAVQELELKFYKWLVPIILGLLFSFAGTIFNFIK